MTLQGRSCLCLVLAWLCSACGARTSVEAGDLTVGGQPSSPVAGAGASTAGSSSSGAAGSAPTQPEPAEPSRVLSIEVGGRHSCAVLSDGLKCWGGNFFGVLGLEDLEARGDEPNEMGKRLPRVNLGRNVVVGQVAPGIAEHACALFGGGRVKCW